MSVLQPQPDTNHTLRRRIEEVIYENGISLPKFAAMCSIDYQTLRSILTQDKLITHVVRRKVEKVLSEFELDTKWGE